MKTRLFFTTLAIIYILKLEAQDLNSFNGSGFNIATSSAPTHAPENTVILGLQSEFDSNYKWQLVNAHQTDNYYLRAYVFGWGNYNKIWHSGNLNRTDIDFNANNLLCSQLMSNKIGIGVSTPSAKLDIYNSYDINNTVGLKMLYNASWGSESYASNFRFIDVSSTEGGKILQVSGYGIGIGYEPPKYLSNDKLYIKGNVGIGTTTPDQALTVKGKIHAEEVIIDLSVPVADYVFKPTYQLMPLHQVESYVKTNSHLPEIPSASEVSKNGMNMGEMQNKLLQKVEELTLYVIEQNKKIEQQSAEINQQNAKIGELEKKLK